MLGGLAMGMLWLGAGCAAGRLADEVYLDSANRYQIRVPPGPWTLVSLDGAVLALRAPDLQGAMALRVECAAPEPGELPWVARHLFFGLTDKQVLSREAVHLHGAAGMRTRLLARLDGRPVEVEGLTVRHGECLYDFMYAAPPATFNRGRADFHAFVQSWTPLHEP